MVVAMCLADRSVIVDECAPRDYQEARSRVCESGEDGEGCDVGSAGRYDGLVEGECETFAYDGFAAEGVGESGEAQAAWSEVWL